MKIRTFIVLSFLILTKAAFPQIEPTTKQLEGFVFAATVDSVEKQIKQFGYKFYNTSSVTLGGEKNDLYAFKRINKDYEELLCIYKNIDNPVKFIFIVEYTSTGDKYFNQIKDDITNSPNTIFQKEFSRNGEYIREYKHGGMFYEFSIGEYKGGKKYDIWIQLTF